jgi:hypothetical protein
LVGEYELAYSWLKRLYKRGFDGDGPFYYWLSCAAFYTGHETFARSIWKKVLELTPDKEGSEPWNQGETSEHTGSIFQKIESDYIEERLFAIYLATVSEKTKELFASKRLVQNRKLTELERGYISYIKTGKPAEAAAAHEVAEVLYQLHQPIGAVESGLYLLWFSVFSEMAADGNARLKNAHAWAGAIEYVWYRLRSEKVSQQEVAERYQLSAATIGKYVKMVKEYLK